MQIMNIQMPPCVTTTLSLSGDAFDPDELTSVIGVEPTQIWRQERRYIKELVPDSELIAWRHHRHKCAAWSLGEAVEAALSVIWEKKDAVRAFAENHGVTVHVACRPYGDASVIIYSMHAQAIQRLAFFNATLSLTIYKSEL